MGKPVSRSPQVFALAITIAFAALPCCLVTGQEHAATEQGKKEAETDWVEKTAADKSFAVSFPGQPQPLRIRGAKGRISVGFAWQSVDGQRMYGVLVDPYASPTPQAYLEGVKQGLVDRKELKSSRLHKWRDRPAADFAALDTTEKGTPRHTHKRIVVDSKRVYMAMVMSLGEDVAADDVQKFFDSFRLLTPYQPPAEDAAIAEGKVFRHPAFGLALPLPEGWFITSQNVNDFRGESPVTGHRLLMVREKQIWKPSTSASFSIIAQPARKDATAEELQRKDLEAGAAKLSFKVKFDKPEPVELGGRDFVRLDYRVQLGEHTLYGRRYDRVEGDYLLTIGGTAPSKEALRALGAVLRQLTFESVKRDE